MCFSAWDGVPVLGRLCWPLPHWPLSLPFSPQDQDGACVQSVSVIVHQDPRKQVTLTRMGDVLLFDQYKITLPYTDGTAQVDEGVRGSWLVLPRLFCQKTLPHRQALMF